MEQDLNTELSNLPPVPDDNVDIVLQLEDFQDDDEVNKFLDEREDKLIKMNQ